MQEILDTRYQIRDTASVRVLLLDNIDSFTWNLAQLISQQGAECTVLSKDDCSLKEIKAYAPDRIVLSPGPGHPKDAHASLSILRAIRDHALSVPVLGVCLGHQCMGLVFGSAAIITKALEPMHGKTSLVHHTGVSIFHSIPSPFTVARYHSLVVSSLPKNFELLAWTSGVQALSPSQAQTIMAMRHTSLPLIGVQFHPESFMTEHGETLMKNFLS